MGVVAIETEKGASGVSSRDRNVPLTVGMGRAVNVAFVTETVRGMISFRTRMSL